MGHLPEPEIDPVSPALASGFLPSVPPGKSWKQTLISNTSSRELVLFFFFFLHSCLGPKLALKEDMFSDTHFRWGQKRRKTVPEQTEHPLPGRGPDSSCAGTPVCCPRSVLWMQVFTVVFLSLFYSCLLIRRVGQAFGPQGTISGPGGEVCVSLRDRQCCNWTDFGMWPMEEGRVCPPHGGVGTQRDGLWHILLVIP